MIVALYSTLHDDAVDTYRTEHERIPDDLVETFARIGIHDWSIWRSGVRLFHLVDCDDFDAAMAGLADDPANARWQAHIGRLGISFHDADGAANLAPLEQIWTLADQLREGAE